MKDKKSPVEQAETAEVFPLSSMFERATAQQKNDFEQGLQSTKKMIDSMLIPVGKNKEGFEFVKQNLSRILNNN
ncbi:hypothetical protein SG34_033555 [Thalassomonas viridans]|uniref:Uncharacterized protein n=1 Tax=Thalassomonas viridans TaxID=137584 RepID=A0AAF0CDH4_9GAMM|nr:hypothetical protein [Thalassomonas viridans]WDE08821.1 hypothetical protein SG34_033555 [Thalassomonas viridans]